MKKAKCAIATYRDNYVYNLTIVNCKGEYINLITYDPVDVAHPYKDRTFRQMLQSILNMAKSNGYDIEHHYCFGCDFYNISLINLDDPKGIIENSFPVKDFMFDNDKMHR